MSENSAVATPVPAIQKGVFIEGVDRMFKSVKEAEAYLRAPKIKAALDEICGQKKELSAFLFDKQEELIEAFASTKMRRVKKAEFAKLEKALEAVKIADETAFGFIKDNADAILSSFRWPKTGTTKPEVRRANTVLLLTSLTNDEEVSQWIFDNFEAVGVAYKAGQPKREMPQSAMDALQKHRDEKKAAALVAEEAVDTPEV